MLSRSKCMRVAEVVARNPPSEVREALQRLQAGPPLPGAAGLRPGRFPWRVIAPPRHPRTRFLPTCASSGWTSRSAQRPGPQVLRVPGRIPAGLRWGSETTWRGGAGVPKNLQAEYVDIPVDQITTRLIDAYLSRRRREGLSGSRPVLSPAWTSTLYWAALQLAHHHDCMYLVVGPRPL